MVEMNQFGSAPPGDPQTCSRCEALLMDVLDGIASAEDQSFFDRHIASCTGCSQMLADARRGSAWLEMLRDPRPEPPAALFERILAQTSGLTGSDRAMSASASATMAGFGPRIGHAGVEQTSRGALLAARPSLGTAGTPAQYAAASPLEGGAKILPFRSRTPVHKLAHYVGQTMLQPRLAMTAAMAFFSIALTLNLTGVHVSELRMSDLRPANLRRGFYEANAHVVRYCDNLRVVYELEARAHDLQRSSDSDAQGSSPAKQDDGQTDAPKQPSGDPDRSSPQKADPKPGPGTSRREPLTHDNLSVASLSSPRAELSARFAPATQLKGDPA